MGVEPKNLENVRMYDKISEFMSSFSINVRNQTLNFKFNGTYTPYINSYKIWKIVCNCQIRTIYFVFLKLADDEI